MNPTAQLVEALEEARELLYKAGYSVAFIDDALTQSKAIEPSEDAGLREAIEQALAHRYGDWTAILEAALSSLPPSSDAMLPCDVQLPPATTISKGCKLSTLHHALELRGMEPPPSSDAITPEEEAYARREIAEACKPTGEDHRRY